MPIYEYFCSSCGSTKEIIQKASDPVASHCPDCQQRTLTKAIARSFGVHFTGTGFYETDYKNKNSCTGSCSSCTTGCAKKSS